MPTITLTPKDPLFDRLKLVAAHRHTGPKDGDPSRDQYRRLLVTTYRDAPAIVGVDGRRLCWAALPEGFAEPGLYDVSKDTLTAFSLEPAPATQEPPLWVSRELWKQVIPSDFEDVPCLPVESKTSFCYACARFGVAVDPGLVLLSEGILFLPVAGPPAYIEGDECGAVIMPLARGPWQTDIDEQAAEYFKQREQQEQEQQEGSTAS